MLYRIEQSAIYSSKANKFIEFREIGGKGKQQIDEKVVSFKWRIDACRSFLAEVRDHMDAGRGKRLLNDLIKINTILYNMKLKNNTELTHLSSIMLISNLKEKIWFSTF